MEIIRLFKDGEPPSQDGSIMWRDLTPEGIQKMLEIYSNQGIDAEPIEAITSYESEPDFNLRDLLTRLSLMEITKDGSVPLVKKISSHPGGYKTQDLNPISYATMPATMPDEQGIVRDGHAFIFARTSGATELEYARARNGLLIRVNTYLQSVGRPQFPPYSSQNRPILHIS